MTREEMQQLYDDSEDGSDFMDVLIASGVDEDEASRWLEYFMNIEDDD